MATPEISYFVQNEAMKLYAFPTPFFFVILGAIIVLLYAQFAAIAAGVKSAFRSIRSNGIMHMLHSDGNKPGIFLFAAIAPFIILHLLRLTVVHPKYFAAEFPLHFILIGIFFTTLPAIPGRIRALAFRLRGTIALIAILACLGLVAGFFYALDSGMAYRGMSKGGVRWTLQACEYILASSQSNYVIENDAGTLWRDNLGEVYTYRTFLEDHYGVPPAQGEKPHRFYIDKRLAGNGQVPLQRYQDAQGYRRFGPVTVFRIGRGD
jgi:hypothetical protein